MSVEPYHDLWLEELIANIWADVLHLKSVARDEHFFELGGDSFSASEMVMRLSDALKIDLPLKSIFDAPTIAQLANTISTYRSGGQVAIAPSIRRPRGTNVVPLSAIQRSTWFLASLAPDLPLYNMTVAITFDFPVNVGVIGQAFNEIVRRHEAWRTTFDTRGTERVQVIHETMPVALRILDLTSVPDSQRTEEANRAEEEDASQPFDLLHGSLLRILLIQLDSAHCRLLLTAHHLVFDGYAVTHIFLPEFQALYEAFLDGKPSPLPDPTLQYADFTLWQESMMAEQVLQPFITYWKNRLRDLPDLPLPGKLENPSMPRSFRGARCTFDVSATLTQALKQLSRRADATLFMTLLTAFKILLAHYAQTSDLAVFVPVSGRTSNELAGIMGLLATAVIVRTQLPDGLTFLDALVRVRAALLEAYTYQGLSLRRLLTLIQASNPHRQGEVLFAFDPIVKPVRTGWQVETEIDLSTAKLDLYLRMVEQGNAIQGILEYKRDMFHAAAIQQICHDLLHVLNVIVARPQITLRDINVP